MKSYRQIVRGNKTMDSTFVAIGLTMLLVAMLTLAALILDLVIQGIPRLDLDFLTSFPSRRAARAGILSSWVGTILVMIVTAVLAIPLGVAAGVYLEEYAPKNWVTDLIEINVTNLAGVPSIIYGLLALGHVVYGLEMGQTIRVAGLVLALLILPIVIVSTREGIRSLPQSMREGAYALGADQWQTVSGYILPSARPAILTGAIVGLSRAIGETAPVITIGALTFIAFLPDSPFQGTFPFINFDWLESPFSLLPIQMFNWVSRPQAAFHANAAAAGVVLLGLTLLMNSFAIYLRYRLRKVMR